MKDWLVQSIKDIEPALHQMACGPNANKMAMCCPAAISFRFVFDFKKRIRRTKHRKTLCQKTTVSLVIHEHTHTPQQKHLCVWGREREEEEEKEKEKQKEKEKEKEMPPPPRGKK